MPLHLNTGCLLGYPVLWNLSYDCVKCCDLPCMKHFAAWLHEARSSQRKATSPFGPDFVGWAESSSNPARLTHVATPTAPWFPRNG